MTPTYLNPGLWISSWQSIFFRIKKAKNNASLFYDWL